MTYNCQASLDKEALVSKGQSSRKICQGKPSLKDSLQLGAGCYKRVSDGTIREPGGGGGTHSILLMFLILKWHIASTFHPPGNDPEREIIITYREPVKRSGILKINYLRHKLSLSSYRGKIYDGKTKQSKN